MIKQKKLKLFIVLLVVIILSIVCSLSIVAVVQSQETPKKQYTIVIDAGHGGRDNGCSGITTGVAESEINLAIAKKLEKILKNYDFKVVLTRTNANGLYEENVDNYKTSDMSKRIEIIEKANADFVISIHQNSYSNSSQRGAQAFYQEGDNDSKNLADCIQQMLISQLDNARNSSNFGDYFILKESKTHAVLVECGYLTNEEDEKLLTDDTYQDKIAYAITCGVIKYFGYKSDEI